MTKTKLPPVRGELGSTYTLPTYNYRMTLYRQGGFCDLKQTNNLDKEECNSLEEGTEEFGATPLSVLVER